MRLLAPPIAEIGWSVATAALFLTLAGLGSRGRARMPGSATGKEIIEVYAQQFALIFRILDPTGGSAGPKSTSSAIPAATPSVSILPALAAKTI
jgi:hypothetical protein